MNNSKIKSLLIMAMPVISYILLIPLSFFIIYLCGGELATALIVIVFIGVYTIAMSCIYGVIAYKHCKSIWKPALINSIFFFIFGLFIFMVFSIIPAFFAFIITFVSSILAKTRVVKKQGKLQIENLEKDLNDQYY